MSWLLPGPAHPHPPRPPAELAAWLGVDEARVRAWLDDGLPAIEGAIDAFVAVNWLSGRIDEVPALASRWRRYLRWFQPFVAGTDRPRRVTVTRHHRLFLPRPVADGILWWLPRLADEAWNVPVDVGPTHVRLRVSAASAVARVQQTPHSHPQPDLIPLVEEVVAGFTYGYRHHRPDDAHGERPAGSCLDLTLALGNHLSARGRPWRVCCGVVAHTALANPHFWLEVEAVGGWVPVDPTLPAIARTFAGLSPAPWREWVRAYTGGCDARRVVLRRGEAPIAGIPGGATLGSLIGEVTVAGVNAWPCLDWVCGECRWEFAGG